MQAKQFKIGNEKELKEIEERERDNVEKQGRRGIKLKKYIKQRLIQKGQNNALKL